MAYRDLVKTINKNRVAMTGLLSQLKNDLDTKNDYAFDTTLKLINLLVEEYKTGTSKTHKNLYLSQRYLVEDTKVSAKDIMEQIQISLENDNLREALSAVDILKAFLKGL